MYLSEAIWVIEIQGATSGLIWLSQGPLDDVTEYQNTDHASRLTSRVPILMAKLGFR